MDRSGAVTGSLKHPPYKALRVNLSRTPLYSVLFL